MWDYIVRSLHTQQEHINIFPEVVRAMFFNTGTFYMSQKLTWKSSKFMAGPTLLPERLSV